jgi:hypothetical protein
MALLSVDLMGGSIPLIFVLCRQRTKAHVPVRHDGMTRNEKILTANGIFESLKWFKIKRAILTYFTVCVCVMMMVSSSYSLDTFCTKAEQSKK